MYILTLMSYIPSLHYVRNICIQGVLKVKVKVKGHVIRALSLILGMSYSVIDGLVLYLDKYEYIFLTRYSIS